MAAFVITGTGTDIGKTVFAAGLCALTGADYWKPVQTGAPGRTTIRTDHAILTDPAEAGPDAATVSALSGARLWAEAVILPEPLSPHRAAELAGITLDPATLTPPPADRLVIEGAGGVLVPITRDLLSADLFARWGLPVIVVATTTLGTISHTLGALESLRARRVPVHGVAFIGPPNADNMATIGALGQVRILGRLPILATLDRATLAAAMAEHFNQADFA